MANYEITERDLEIATKNWEQWQSVFEFQGPVANNPLLADSSTFAAFLDEYSVRRTIRRGTSDKLRITLSSPAFELQALLNDTSGKLLDAGEAGLRSQFGTLSGARGLRSAMSKIAAFLAPHAFIAWDDYARKGLNMVLERSLSKKFDGYAEYITYMNRLLSGEFGERVRCACGNGYPTEYASRHDRFHRRVLDVALMRVGGRSF
jgi:hypothetical protein